MARSISAGVLVTDGDHLLLGHVTGNRHWDIPKGRVDPGETHLEAAVRELREETSLVVDPSHLEHLGLHRYKKGKDLSLWAWRIDTMPDTNTLDCLSFFDNGKGAMKKEMDAFSAVPWESVQRMVVPDMWKVIKGLIGHVQRGQGRHA